MTAQQDFEWVQFSSSGEKAYCGQRMQYDIVISNKSSEKRSFHVRMKAEFRQQDPDLSWEFMYFGSVNRKNVASESQPILLSPSSENSAEKKLEIEGNLNREFQIILEAPRGAYSGDRISLLITVSSDDGIEKKEFRTDVEITTVIVVARANVGKEFEVAQNLINADRRDYEERMETNPNAQKEIISVLSPYELKGYFYLEVIHPDRIPLIAKKMRDFKGIIDPEKGFVNPQELAKYFEQKPSVTGISIADSTNCTVTSSLSWSMAITLAFSPLKGPFINSTNAPMFIPVTEGFCSKYFSSSFGFTNPFSGSMIPLKSLIFFAMSGILSGWITSR